ncbi:MAG: N-acetylmuramoyl-L-alanine amidase, partial [Gemmatimonadetes bacterium]|nr:N-acetylmuramoyl-L-alanine amidase [Gemmatimonadota bacterium]
MSPALIVLLACAPAPPRPSVAPLRPCGAPTAITIVTPRGQARLPVIQVGGAPMLPAGALATSLGGRLSVADGWADLLVATLEFRFLLDAPVLVRGPEGVLVPLAAPAVARDQDVLLPLQFVTELLPGLLRERYSYDAPAGRFTETGPTPLVRAPPRQVPRLPNGLLPGHVVVVDPGHGAEDPGNPAPFFPRGLKEKHITLQVGLLLRTELEKQGITVRMTRTTDTRPKLTERARLCSDDCDLFVSLHVDALPPSRRDRASVSGFHTLIIGEENTEDADRVARMENEALRYEGADTSTPSDALGFVLRDLQMNEHLRESAAAGALVQSHLAQVHPGENRGVRQSNRLAVLNTA